MNQKTTPIFKNCGNFSSKVLSGLIAYGRESESPGRQKRSSSRSQGGDGYATREHDIKLGGFIHTRSAQMAQEMGKSLFGLSVEEKQAIALKVCREHLQKYGEIGRENYSHWLKRAVNFARYNHIELPKKLKNEKLHSYYRRVRKYISGRPEKWPELQKAAGTHLVFSPDPKIWDSLRNAGCDERTFLRNVIVATMKDVQDQRRKQFGHGHGLGWVAGTHVRDNGADQHPHIHVVVLKRDESGAEVDWSVSALKGRKGRSQEYDPIRQTKQFFQKNVQKELDRTLSKPRQIPLPKEQEKPNKSRVLQPEMIRQIRKITRTVFPRLGVNPNTEIGALMRLMRMYRQHRTKGQSRFEENLPTLTGFKRWLENQLQKKPTPSLQPGDDS